MAKALVCFPPSLDPMAHEHRLPATGYLAARPLARPPSAAQGLGMLLALLSHEQFVGSSRGARPQPGTAPHRRRDPWGRPPAAGENCALPGFRDPLQSPVQ